jgi:hypothetical protein
MQQAENRRSESINVAIQESTTLSACARARERKEIMYDGCWNCLGRQIKPGHWLGVGVARLNHLNLRVDIVNIATLALDDNDNCNDDGSSNKDPGNKV